MLGACSAEIWMLAWMGGAFTAFSLVYLLFFSRWGRGNGSLVENDLLRFVKQTRNFYELMEAMGDLQDEEALILAEARRLIAKAES